MENKPEVKVVYKQLQERLDKYPIGAPASKDLYGILELLFGEEYADIAARMPMKPAPLDKLSKRFDIPEDRLGKMFGEMASRGLIIDFPHKGTGKTYYMLTPTIVGFFEFAFMRERDDFSQKRLAELMESYSNNRGGEFVHEIFREQTQVGRVVPHETALSADQAASLPDSDSVSRLIDNASMLSVSHCYCRHKARLLGHACGRPEEVCIGLEGSDYLIRNGLARRITAQEAHDLVAQAREAGLVHVVDNILDGPGFLCNCCGCCCGMLQAINKNGLTYAVHTSTFAASISEKDCKGCRKCANLCPIGAIEIRKEALPDGKVRQVVIVDESVCLGCGVCVAACRFNAILMNNRGKRTLTPANTLERLLMMAVERGKLHNFLFDDMKGPTAGFLKAFTGAFLNLPVSKRLLLNKEIRSKFLEFASRVS